MHGAKQTPARDYRDIIDLARVDHFFWDLYRIGLGSTNTNMVSKHIDIGHIGVGNIDIVLVLTKLVKKMTKISDFFGQNHPKMTNTFGIGVVSVLQENFFDIVLVSS